VAAHAEQIALAIGAHAGLLQPGLFQSSEQLQVSHPLLDRLPHLPEPQCEALETAFGIRAGAPPDRFLVGLGVLGLLSDDPTIIPSRDIGTSFPTFAQTLAALASGPSTTTNLTAIAWERLQEGYVLGVGGPWPSDIAAHYAEV
jgi:hypothetical protein